MTGTKQNDVLLCSKILHTTCSTGMIVLRECREIAAVLTRALWKGIQKYNL